MKRVIILFSFVAVLFASVAIADLTFGGRGMFGASSSHEWKAYVDDSTVVNVQEPVRWFGIPNDSTGGAEHWLAQGNGSTNRFIFLRASSGGRLRIDSASIHLGNNNVTADAKCDWDFHINESSTPPNFVMTSKGPSTGWLSCGNTIQTGTGSVNTGGVGDSTLRLVGAQYLMPQPGCECATTACQLVLMVSDRTVGANVCTQIQDITVTVFGSELF